MEKIINKLIDEFIKGVDTYTHNGSTWLIFTDKKEWVIELTESKTLWYNYNFFKGVFAYVSMDVVENQHYITKWVEDNVINKVKDTILEKNITEGEVEEIIENGVKEHSLTYVGKQIGCEDTIKNGVKHTEKSLQIDGSCVIEDTIENGVKETSHNATMFQSMKVEDTIEHGVKETNHVDVMKFFDNKMDDAIKNGVKETELHKGVRPNAVGETIQNGVKETMFNQGHKQLTVKNIIKNGVRHTLNTEYMPTSMVEDIIQSGVKETRLEMNITEGEVDDIIQDGVKEIYEYKGFRGDVKDVIQDGVRKTLWISTEREGLVNTTINQGVKETKTPGKDGDILSTIEWMEENKSNSYTKMIDDVIDNGIKEVRPLPEQSGELIGYGDYYKLKEDRTKPFIDYLEETIKFGVKESLG
jgi:hypothetical protein